jgi:hypothetical protein
MTRETAKKWVVILTAFSEGKTIQREINGSYFDTEKIESEAIDFLRIKPEPKTRPMTRGEVLYKVTTTPAMVMRRHHYEPCAPAFFSLDEDVDDLEYAIIDKYGEPIDGWHKFEVEE